MKAAIVCLTRGYSNPQYYGSLIVRNRHIFENFNKKLKQQYPLVIFHEGNIPKEHQDFILSHEKNSSVSFVNIAEEFKMPPDLHISEVRDDRFHLGYRFMCRFFVYGIWKYIKEYDYFFRIDEDTLIGELNYDIFEHMRAHSLDYMPSRFTHEYHEFTNETIPEVAESLLQGKWKASDYDQTILWVPLTNLYASSVKFFMQEHVQKFLQAITSDKRFIIYRWGDHVVQGICLKTFSSPDKVKVIHDFASMHGSHGGALTVNGRPMEGIMSGHEAKFFNCVPSGQGGENTSFTKDRVMHYKAAELMQGQ